MRQKPDETNAEEHLDYLVSSVRLMLWFARKWALAHPEEAMADILQKRVDIYRRTDLYCDYLDSTRDMYVSEKWSALKDALIEFYNRTKADPDSSSFEQCGIDLMLPGFKSRVERDLEDIKNRLDVAKYQCGSLRYDLAISEETPGRIGFHIANACYPRSIFDDPLYLPGCFFALMTECEARFGATEIRTGTWLNSHPKWLALFPEEWAVNMGPPNTEPGWHYGFWGQFLTARKTFNHKLGRIFRDTGEFPYPPRSSWCSMAAMRKHLLRLVGSV